MAKALLIRQKRSKSQCTPVQRATLHALGLSGVDSYIYRQDRLSIRGMLNKVQHLIEAEQVDSVPEAKKRGRGATDKKTGTGIKIG